MHDENNEECQRNKEDCSPRNPSTFCPHDGKHICTCTQVSDKKEDSCKCSSMSCKIGCTKNHTCHTYSCEKCQPNQEEASDKKDSHADCPRLGTSDLCTCCPCGCTVPITDKHYSCFHGQQCEEMGCPVDKKDWYGWVEDLWCHAHNLENSTSPEDNAKAVRAFEQFLLSYGSHREQEGIRKVVDFFMDDTYLPENWDNEKVTQRLFAKLTDIEK